MTRPSDARAHRRAMKRAGVAVAVRVEVRDDASDYGVRVRAAVSEALRGLESQGGDLRSRLAITVGSDHPNFPGKTIVEAKASDTIVLRPPHLAVIDELPEATELSFDALRERIVGGHDGEAIMIEVDPDRDDAGQ